MVLQQTHPGDCATVSTAEKMENLQLRQFMKRVSGIVLIIVLLGGCSYPVLNTIALSAQAEAPLKIVQISDLHFVSNRDIYTQMVEKINTLAPDVFVITGDLIDKPEVLPALITCLSTISIQCPKYAILGNWEYWCGVNQDELRSLLSGIGITLLVNEQVTIPIRTSTLCLYGMDDYLGGNPHFTGFLPESNQHNIVLAHCPVLFDTLTEQYKNSNIPILMLSGHTHGGQITLFGLPVALPEGSGKYCAGVYNEGNCTLYVSRGIGNSMVDMRLFADPAIEIISF